MNRDFEREEESIEPRSPGKERRHPPRPRPCCGSSARTGAVRPGIVFGGALVIFGAGFLLSRLGMLGGLSAWQVWPAVLVLAGLVKLTELRGVGQLVFAFVLIGAGVFVQLHYLGYVQMQWSLIWPALLILLGLVVVLSSLFRPRPRRHRSGTGEVSGTSLSGSVIFGGHQEDFTGREIDGGEIRCTMGGYEADLRGATIRGDEAVVDVRALMGGVELKVPDDWLVVIHGTPVMGAFENKTGLRRDVDPETAKRLVIRGSVVMGGIEVGN